MSAPQGPREGDRRGITFVPLGDPRQHGIPQRVVAAAKRRAGHDQPVVPLAPGDQQAHIGRISEAPPVVSSGGRHFAFRSASLPSGRIAPGWHTGIPAADAKRIFRCRPPAVPDSDSRRPQKSAQLLSNAHGLCAAPVSDKTFTRICRIDPA